MRIDDSKDDQILSTSVHTPPTAENVYRLYNTVIKTEKPMSELELFDNKGVVILPINKAMAVALNKIGLGTHLETNPYFIKTAFENMNTPELQQVKEVLQELKFNINATDNSSYTVDAAKEIAEIIHTVTERT